MYFPNRELLWFRSVDALPEENEELQVKTLWGLCNILCNRISSCITREIYTGNWNVTESFQNGIWIQYLLLYPSPYFTTTKGKNIKSTANKCNKIKQLIMNYFLKVNVILLYVRETYTLFYYPVYNED